VLLDSSAIHASIPNRRERKRDAAAGRPVRYGDHPRRGARTRSVCRSTAVPAATSRVFAVADVAAGSTVRITDTPELFEVETHGSGLVLLQLAVR
jgi:hypothetical protein